MTFDGKRQLTALLILCALTAAIYIPNSPNTFVDWDLVSYKRVLETKDYFRTAIDLFKDVKGEIVPGYYAPLSSISLMLDNALTGEPSARLTVFLNLLLHCVVGILVFRLALTVGANVENAILAAAIFLIHPVQVSSVLWFAQRKGVMAAVFYLLSYIVYLKYLKSGGLIRYFGSLLCFTAAVFSKPTAVMLPVALVFSELLLNFKTGQKSRYDWLLRVAPFFALAIIFGLITMGSEGLSSSEIMPDLPIYERPFIAAAAIWFYLGKALLPIGIAPLYATWDVDPFSVLWWLPIAAFAIVGILLLIYRRRVDNHILWGLLNFLIPFFPVCGLMKFGYLRLSNVADHFMYLSMVGFSLMIAMSVDSLRCRLRNTHKYFLAAGICTYLLFLMIQAIMVSQVWKDSVTLWKYAMEMNPQSWSAHNFLGHALMNSGRSREAIGQFNETLRLKRQFLAQKDELANELERNGDGKKAETESRKAHPIRVGMYMAYHNSGNAYLLSSMLDRAAEQFQIALALRPGYVNSRVNIGIAKLGMGRITEALEHLSIAVMENPGNFEAHYNLGLAYEAAGEKTKAEEHFLKAHALRPDFPSPVR